MKKKVPIQTNPKKSLSAILKSEKVFHFYNNETTVVCTSKMFGVTFVGVARLKEGDNTDVKTAMYIAETKMERSFYKYQLQSIKLELKCIEDNKQYLENRIAEYNRNIKACTNHIIDLCNKD